MANPNAPHGANPVGYVNGAPWSGKANLYSIPTSDVLQYMIGDFVSTVANADVNGVPAVARAANGAAITSTALRGVIVGFQVAPIGVASGAATQGNNVNLNITYVPATKTTPYYALVADDPNLIFEIMGDNSGASLTLATSINNNAGYTQGTPTTTDVVSRTVLTTGTIATTATFALKILSLPYRPNVDNTANTPLLVVINNHELKGGTGTAGI